MDDYKKLYGSIKLDKETVFYHSISQDKEKLAIFKEALMKGLITSFDQVTISRLRRLYYAYYSGILYIFYYPTTFNNIGNKVELFSHVLNDKDYQLVHGDTDSTRNIPFFMYGVEHLDFNSWYEVKEGHKIWVYDLFSLLKIEKDVYYKLENPKINRVIPANAINNHPGREKDDFSIYHNGFDYNLIKIIPQMEKSMNTHPFASLLIPEITRFKQEIDFERIVLEYNTEFKRNLF